jgi:hypothetical protein
MYHKGASRSPGLKSQVHARTLALEDEVGWWLACWHIGSSAIHRHPPWPFCPGNQIPAKTPERTMADDDLEINRRRHFMYFDACNWIGKQVSRSDEWHVTNAILRSNRPQSRGPHVKCAPDSRDPPQSADSTLCMWTTRLVCYTSQVISFARVSTSSQESTLRR